MTYRFAANDFVEFAIAPLSGTIDAVTVAAFFLRTPTGTGDAIVSFNNPTLGASPSPKDLRVGPDDKPYWFDGTNFPNGTQVMSSTTEWDLLVFTKAAGSGAACRFHVHNGTSWSHVAGNATVNPFTNGGTDRLRVGMIRSTLNPFGGDLVCVGVKKSDSSDVAVEALSRTAWTAWTGFGFDWLIGFDASLESAGLLQDQATLGTGDEVSISGTSQVADPPGWSWASGVATSYSSEVLADNPLLYLRFEETSGATCANVGSLGGSATANGTYTRNIATSMAGLGVGIDLDGVGNNDFVSYPDTAALDITGNVTYECWAAFDTNPTPGGWTLMAKGSGGGGTGYSVRVDSATRQITIEKSGTTFLLQPGVFPAGTGWHHFAFTRSGNTYTVYIDGVPLGSSGTNSTAITATDQPFTIGQDTNSTSDGFNGKVDEVAVYNTALSAARIAAHYAARNTADAVVASTFVPQIVIT